MSGGRRRFTRRDLLKAAPAAGAGAGAAALAMAGTSAAKTHQVTGHCRFCLLHCGLVGTVQGSRLVRVDGDPSSSTRGFLCLHGHALPEVVHSSERVRTPLVRRAGRLRPASWSEALAFVAERMQGVRERFGPEAVVFQTGWPLVRHPLGDWVQRLAAAWGTPNVVSVGSLCETAGRMGQALTVGSKYKHDLRRTRTLVLWGANPTHSTPLFAHVVAGKASDGNLVVIDPVRTELAALATEHVSVRPGTDGALALGFMHVLVAEGLVDRVLLEEETVGFEALAGLVRDYPPERTEQLTGVPRAQVVRVARLLGQQTPTGIWSGLGVEHHENGVQTVRAVTALEALCRRSGEPEIRQDLTPVTASAEGVLLPALPRPLTPEPVPLPVRARPLGSDTHPLFEIFNREAQGNLIARAILEDRPYPVRALVLVASNALVTAPGSAELQRAAEKLELLVTVDPFLSESARRSHVVLPAATFAETPLPSEGGRGAQHALVPPEHGAWPDWRIVFELARSLGLGRYFPWTSWDEAERAPRRPYRENPARQPGFETSQARYGTPSGRIELASGLLARHGQEALPVWHPPSIIPTPAFPLLLVSGPRTGAYINSQFRQVARVRLKIPEPQVRVHPDAARAAGVADGERVALISPLGRVEMQLVVTTDVRPELAVADAGWEEANVNLLHDASRLDPISGFPAFRSGVCRLERATSRPG